MNDEMNKLRDRLEAATSPDDGNDGSLEPSTRTLREGWLALGRILDEAESPLVEPAENWRPATEVRSARRPVSTRLLLAASLMIAFGAVWAWYSVRPNGEGSSPQPIVTHPPKPDTSIEAPKQRLAAQAETSAKPQVQWDDQIDDQLAATARAVMLARQDGYSQIGTYDSLQNQLKTIEEDFEDGAL